MRLAVLATVAFASSLALVAVLRRSAERFGIVDVPNERSSHTRPIPRGGGLAFAVIAPIIVLVASQPLSPLAVAALAGSILVAAVSFADDVRGLSPLVRLAAHAAAAFVVIVPGGVIETVALPAIGVWPTGWFAIPITVIWLVGMTNVYNFMDGIDGIAAAQALVVATAAAAMAAAAGADSVAVAMAVVAGAAAGFLIHNWSPARIFMGDVGSAFLGFWFGAWAIVGAREHAMPLALWCLIMGAFLFDTTFTLIRRLWRGESLYRAHREHLYQRLVRAGWSHRSVASLYLSLTTLLCGVGLARHAAAIGDVGAVAVVSMLFALLVCLVVQVERRTIGSISPEPRA